MALITIITPTYKRNLSVVLRCVESVKSQTFKDYEHIVCSDGYFDEKIQEESILRNFKYMFSPANLGNYGAGIRTFVQNQTDSKYLVFLDDDNILYSNYLEKMISNIGLEKYVTCDILHCGMVQEFVGKTPLILKGNNIQLYWIDTLQMMVERKMFEEVGGWEMKGYCSDGYTYQKIHEIYPNHAYVSEVLAIHI